MFVIAAISTVQVDADDTAELANVSNLQNVESPDLAGYSEVEEQCDPDSAISPGFGDAFEAHQKFVLSNQGSEDVKIRLKVK